MNSVFPSYLSLFLSAIYIKVLKYTFELKKKLYLNLILIKM